jgi:serine protease Do
MRTTLFQFVVFCITITQTYSTCWSSNENPHIYLMPIAEITHIITGWLTDSGLQIDQKKTAQGQIRILGTDSARLWDIVLEPHSPLSTGVLATFSNNGTGPGKTEDLYDFLLQYPKEPATATPLILADIPPAIQKKLESLVCLHAVDQGESVDFSGFFIDNEGLILSTAHGLKEHEAITVIDLTGLEYRGEVIKLDSERDLTLIRIPESHINFIPLETGRNLLGMGEKIFSVGCPNNLQGTVYTGMINGPPRRIGQLPFWQVLLEIQPGSSGSPVFDEQGALVAVIKGRFRENDTTGLLIPMETIIDFLNDFLAK